MTAPSTFGLTMGFSQLIPADLLAAVKQFGWTHIRNGNRDDTAFNLQIAQQIQASGLTPAVGILRAPQFPSLPLTDIMIEASSTGVEAGDPDPAREAAKLNPFVAWVRLKRLSVYVGMRGTNRKDLAYTATLCEHLDPIFGISVHRYPPARATNWQAPQWKSRAYELEQLKAAIGTRPFIVGEFGYHQGQYKTLLDEILFWRHHHRSDQQVLDAIEGEFGYWKAAGSQATFLYQFSDGPSHCPRHATFPLIPDDGFGIRRVDSHGAHLSWKTCATVPQR